jgi:hypothetical protein
MHHKIKKEEKQMRIIRVLFSILLFVVAAVALVGFFIGSSALVIDPIKEAITPSFDFQELGMAVFFVISLLGTPLILIALAIIGITGGKKVAR